MNTNTTAHFESYRLKLLPLCPIHVGSGDSIEPFEYDVTYDARGHADHGKLNVYDIDACLSNLTSDQHEEFEKQNSLGWHEARSFLRQQYQHQSPRYSIVIKENAAKELQASLDDRNRSGEIHLLPRSPLENEAYIPGSSVKGAIRTALLNAELLQKTSDSRQARELISLGKQSARNDQAFQARVLDYENDRQRADIQRDPFRQVALADFSVHSNMTHIDRIQIKTKRGNRGSGSENILMYRELTNSYLGHHDVNQAFSAELRLFPQLAQRHTFPQPTRHPNGYHPLPFTITWDHIRDACNDFYTPHFEHELEVHVREQPYHNLIADTLKSIGPNDCLIRVGRHSHFECVTVDPAYSTEPRNGFGKTRSFVQGLVPLGWARLSIEPQPTNP